MAVRIPFRERGTHMSRIDGFSDVVFGFALTLIVVSLEVPHTFHELLDMLKGFIPFSICFYFLIQIWYVHYRFFRRYGLEDIRTIVYNSMLLFVVLMFVYPLKFLFTIATIHPANTSDLTAHEARLLFLVYGLGYAAVWAIFALMHHHAMARRQHLELTVLEMVDTRQTIAMCLCQVAVGLLSIAVAFLVPSGKIGFTGMTYMLLAFTNSWVGAHYGKQRRLLEDKLLANKSEAVSV